MGIQSSIHYLVQKGKEIKTSVPYIVKPIYVSLYNTKCIKYEKQHLSETK